MGIIRIKPALFQQAGQRNAMQIGKGLIGRNDQALRVLYVTGIRTNVVNLFCKFHFCPEFMGFNILRPGNCPGRFFVFLVS
jgi:hypothetical protein